MNWVSKVMMLFWGLLLSGLCASGAQLKDPSTRLLLRTVEPLRVVEPDDRPNVLFIIVEPTQVDRVAELSRRLAQGWQKALPPRLAE